MATVHPLIDRVTRGHTQRLLCFGLVGLSGILVNTVILYLLVEAGHVNHLVAAALGSEVSILSNFALNDRWTFRDARPTTSWLQRAAQYNAVTLTGMVLSVGVLALLVATVNLHYVVANLLAIGAATLSNYVLNSRFTWSASLPAKRSRAALAPVTAVDW
jgi:dolichol-phosphate mannosyltransferase